MIEQEGGMMTDQKYDYSVYRHAMKNSISRCENELLFHSPWHMSVDEASLLWEDTIQYMRDLCRIGDCVESEDDFTRYGACCFWEQGILLWNDLFDTPTPTGVE